MSKWTITYHPDSYIELKCENKGSGIMPLGDLQKMSLDNVCQYLQDALNDLDQPQDGHS